MPAESKRQIAREPYHGLGVIYNRDFRKRLNVRRHPERLPADDILSSTAAVTQATAWSSARGPSSAVREAKLALRIKSASRQSSYNGGTSSRRARAACFLSY